MAVGLVVDRAIKAVEEYKVKQVILAGGVSANSYLRSEMKREMEEYLCDICKKEPARIQITGKGRYCLNCHNEMVLKEYGLEDTFDYPETMTVIEPDGAIHIFKVEHIILGAIVSWDAYEQGGNYHDEPGYL